MNDQPGNEDMNSDWDEPRAEEAPAPKPSAPAAAAQPLPPLAESLVASGLIAIAAITCWMLYGPILRHMLAGMWHYFFD